MSTSSAFAIVVFTTLSIIASQYHYDVLKSSLPTLARRGINVGQDELHADNKKCNLKFDNINGNLMVDNEIWLTTMDTSACVRYNGKEVCTSDDNNHGGEQNEDEKEGIDPIGKFREHSKILSFDSNNGDPDEKKKSLQWKISNRYYTDEPTTLLFGQEFLSDFNKTSYPAKTVLDSASKGMSSWFPSFRRPREKNAKTTSGSAEINTRLGYLEFNGMFIGSENYHIGSLSELQTNDAVMSGPIAIFSTECVVVMSIASSFMSSSYLLREDLKPPSTRGEEGKEKKTKEFGFGVMGSITNIPKGHELSVIISSSPITKERPDSIRNAFHVWGSKLRRIYDTHRPTDSTLKYLQFSTDNGAYYYYNTEDGKNYEQTIIDVKDYADDVRLPFRNWLADSWWYYKGYNDGVKKWAARPDIFPNGLSNVAKQTKWDVVAHNRYWSSNTDYAKQNGGKYNFVIEEDPHKIALPIDESFWNDLFEESKLWGLAVYEQDWLNVQTRSMNITLQSTNVARTWLQQMGNGAEQNNILIQYCMSWPRHILQTLEIPAVTQARASGDYQPNNNQWLGLGLSSMFSYALDVAPLKDNFWSSNEVQPGSDHPYPQKRETANILQSAVATYSMGSVAPSDKIKYMNVSLIMKSCNEDGKLLQPDMPAVRTDKTILNEAGLIQSNQTNQVWSTMTNLSGFVYTYILVADSPYAFDIRVDDLHYSSLSPEDYVIWDLNDMPFKPLTMPHQVPITTKSNIHVYCIAPILDNGFALLGEAETKWTSVSQNRFTQLEIIGNEFSVNVEGSPNEIVHMIVRTPNKEYVRIDCFLSISGLATFYSSRMSCSSRSSSLASS